MAGEEVSTPGGADIHTDKHEGGKPGPMVEVNIGTVGSDDNPNQNRPQGSST